MTIRMLRCVAMASILCMALMKTGLEAQERWHASAKDQLVPRTEPPLSDMAHMSWVRRDGAPSDITALAQTNDGYLWIGSALGLFRFDGLKFSSYPFSSADPQLPSSNISALAASPDGGLWIGYRMGGMSYLRGDRKVDYDKRSGLVSESTEQIVCREDGSVWATADGRLMRFTGTGWENYSAAHGLSSDGLYSLFFDRDGNLYTAYKEHVFVLRKGSEQFVPVLVPNHAVNQFAQTPDGTIWASDAWNSVRPLLASDSKTSVRLPGVPLLLVDDEGNLWVAHDTGGLTRVKFANNSIKKVEAFDTTDGLTDGQTRAILKDKQGAVWIGTARGLDQFQPSPLKQFYGVHLSYYPALLADGTSGIWVDDMDKPLMRVHNGKVSFFGKAHGSSSLAPATNGGLWLHDPITHNFYRFSSQGELTASLPVPEVAKEVENWCFGEDLQGNLMACFEGHGLWRYSGAWQQVKAQGLPTESPLSLVKGPGGKVWLGFPHNQIAVESESGFHIYGVDDGLALNAVLTFMEMDSVVLAGGSDGVAMFDGRRFHSLSLRSPGVMRNVSGIVKDRFGGLWLNGGAGVIHVRAKEWRKALRDPQYAMDFELISDRDGLIGTPAQSKPTPSAVVDSDGNLWFATSGHLVFIDPATFKEEQEPLSVLLQSVHINGSVVKPDGQAITVDSRHLQTLQFDYIAINLKSPTRVSYEYMLEGQDKQWQSVGARQQAYYTNLAPGSYRFRVRAANGTGKWNELQSNVALSVMPAFYQTYWFLALCVVGTVLIVWIAYRWRLRRLALRLDSQFEARLSERTRIAQELHDTLLQGVLSASMQLSVADDQLEQNSAAKPIVKRVLELMRGVIDEGRDAVQGLRIPNSGNLSQAFKRIPEELALPIATTLRVSEMGVSRKLHPIIHDEVYRIGREAISNALRHSSASTVEVLLDYSADELRIAVQDDGCGIDPHVLRAGRDGHWGLAGMRERAERIGAKVKIAGRNGGGTEVELRVPSRIAFEPEAGARLSRWVTRLQSERAAKSERNQRAV